MKVKLSNGFECEVDENILDNMELIDAIAGADDDVTNVSALVKMIFGDNKKALYDSLREDGRVSVSSIVSAIKEVLEAAGEEGKNS